MSCTYLDLYSWELSGARTHLCHLKSSTSSAARLPPDLKIRIYFLNFSSFYPTIWGAISFKIAFKNYNNKNIIKYL